jgi:pilus assembly protein CpaE
MAGPEPNLCDETRTALIVAPDEALAAEVAALLSSELPGFAIRGCGYASGTALERTIAGAGLALCLLDACSDRDSAFAVLAEIGARAPALPVIALLPRNDPDLILQCLRRGAGEFLIRPFSAGELQAALAKFSRDRLHAGGAGDLARICCVLPGKRSCGAATVACNLAFRLRDSGGGKTLLADLDPLTGTLSFLLKLKSSYSFLDAVARAAALDADLWRAIVCPCDGIDVLLSPEHPAEATAGPGDPEPVIRYARRAYGTVVLCLGGPFGDWNLSLARQSDDLLVVTSNELPALRGTQRAIAHLEANGIERSRLRLILNRHSHESGLQPDAIRTALRCDVFHVLPDDPEAIRKSLLDGRPALRASRFGASVEQLADRLSGRCPRRPKSSVLSGVLAALGRRRQAAPVLL